MPITIRGRNDWHEGWIAGIVMPSERRPEGRSAEFLDGWDTAKESGIAEYGDGRDMLSAALRETVRRGDFVRASISNVEAW